MSETKTNTTVEQVTADDLDNLLGMPGAGVANMTPGATDPKDPAEPEKPTFFQKEKVDMEFLDPNAPEDPEPADPTPTPEPADPQDPADPAEPAPADPSSFESLVNDLEDQDPEEVSKGGRPKLNKAGMAQLAQALIDDKVILPFDEDKSLEDYTMDDYKELFSLNIQERERAVMESTPKEFFESLPNELQLAARYVADGGQDLKGLFKSLAASQEVRTLDIGTERGQEHAVRDYLRASDFGNEEQIQEQIDSWKDLGKLEGKAQQFKPKLDKMQDAVVKRQIEEQAYKRQQQEEASMNYANSIYDTLAKGELNGLKLNNKTQNLLYQGLIQPNYPSVSGQNTNLFGHLIEKHQFVEPNHGLIAEALWLLADPEGYRNEIKQGAQNKVAEETARQLKIEQQNKNGGGDNPEPGNERTRNTTGRRAIKRPSSDFFKR